PAAPGAGPAHATSAARGAEPAGQAAQASAAARGASLEIAEVQQLVVAPAEAGERLDRLVAARLPSLSRARVQALIEQGLVLIGGVPGRASARPEPGAAVEVRLPRV